MLRTEGIRDEELEDWVLGLSDGRAVQKQRWGGEIFPRDFPFSWNGETVFEAFQRTRVKNERKGMILIDLQTNLLAIEKWLEENGEEADGN